MSRANKKPDSTSRRRLTDAIIAKQRKKFGDDSISTSGGYGDINGYLDTGVLAINYAIGHDGIPRGRLTTLQGAEQAGKTSTITKMLAMCQQRGGLAVYIDAEYKFDRNWAARLGLFDDQSLPQAIAEGRATDDTLPLMIIYPEHIQKVFQQLEALIDQIREEDEDVEVLIAWDSVAATPSTAEFEANYDNNQPGSPARQMSAGLKKLCFKLARENVTMLAVNQEKEAIGFTGPSAASKVATIAQRPLAFHSTVRIEVKGAGYVARGGEDGRKEENAIGVKVAARIAKNQCGPKGRVARFNLITVGRNVGPDNDQWILDYALDAAKPAIVIKSGAFCHMRGSDDKWYAKDFKKTADYAKVKSLVQDAMEQELADRFGRWVPGAEKDDEDDEDGETGPAVGALSDEELAAFENGDEE